jgi:hypothetical protein
LKAFSQLRDQPWYRRQAFELGLKRMGFEVLRGAPLRASKGDVLLIWNRYGQYHEMALHFEKQGGTVLVAENGYLGADGTSPKFDVHPGGPKPHHYYALSIGWHNGRGRQAEGGPERFAALGVKVKPWRTDEDILICPNRSFGVGEQVMHPDWAIRVAERLKKVTKRPVRIRSHPGNDEPKRKLVDDLAGVGVMVIWSSSAGVHALVEGIAVISEAPHWICKDATFKSLQQLTVLGAGYAEREKALERMAWAQWTLAEIETGEPLRHLLPAAG